MPMIDVYVVAGRVANAAALARNLAATLMRIEGVPDIAMFRQNTAAFIHELAPDSISNVDGTRTAAASRCSRTMAHSTETSRSGS